MNIKLTFFSGLLSLFSCLAAWGGENGKYNVTFTSGTSTQNMATIEAADGGTYATLSEAVSAANSGFTELKRVNVEGDIPVSEATALGDIDCATLDISQAKGLTPESFTNENVNYVVLPDAWDKEAVNTFGTNPSNKNLLSAAAANYIYVKQTLRHYYDGYTEITDTSKVKIKDNGGYYYSKELSKDVKVTLVEGYPQTSYSYTYETQTYAVDASDVHIDNNTITSLKIPLLTETVYYRKDGTTILQSWEIKENGEGKKIYYENNEEIIITNIETKYYYLTNWGNTKVYCPDNKTDNGDGTYYTTVTFDTPQSVTVKTTYRYSYLNYDGNETLYFDQENEYQGSTKTVTKNVDTDLRIEYKEHTNKEIELTAYVRKPGNLVYTVMKMSHFNSSWSDSNALWYNDEYSKYSYTCEDLKKVTISGIINAKDINSQTQCIDAQGNYVESNGNAYTTLFNNTAYYFDFSDAEFDPNHPEDMTMSGFFYTPCGNITEIKLPTAESQTTIPKNFIKGSTKIVSLCIPHNYKVIEPLAFNNAHALKHIYTTDPDNTEENPNAVKVDHGDGTFTFSAKLEHIQSEYIQNGNGYNYTFFGDAMQKYVKDIYVNAVKAPKCDAYSFQGDLTYGNNGFKGNWTHPISRENYTNGEHVICILHYPTASKSAEKEGGVGFEEENYTDITRNYTLNDETGVVDGYGITKRWPRHAEFFRSYNQAVTGYIWKDWQEYEEGKTEVISTKDDKYIKQNPTKYNQEYQGWHEFVLAENYITKEFKPQTFYNEFDQKDWYTICVPYNVTKSVLLKAFGVSKAEADNNSVKMMNSEKYVTASTVGTDDFSDAEWLYPDVRSLIQVKRSYNQSVVTLCLSEPLITKSKCQEVTIPDSKQGYEYNPLSGDDPVIIKAGMPYLIRPFIPNDEKIANFGSYIVAYATQNNMEPERVKVFANDETTYTVPKEKGVESQALNYDQTTENNPVYVGDCKYYFVGTYVDSYVPQYGYYLGRSKSGKHTFFRAANEGTTKWNHYSAIIKGISEPKYKQGGTGQTSITNISIEFKNIVDDLITLPSEKPAGATAKRLSFGFDDSGINDDVASSMEEIEVEFVLPEEGDGIIRTIGGVPVRTDNLPKGIYIRNGKKFVVR